MTIDNIQLQEYLVLEPEKQQDYNILQCVKGSSQLTWFTGKELETLTYKDIIELRRFKGSLNDVCLMFRKMFDMNQTNVLRMPIIDYFKAINFFKDQLIKINEFELKMLKMPKSKYTAQWEEAEFQVGIRLAEFGELNIIAKLCGHYGWTIEYVEDMDYLSVITIYKHLVGSEKIQNEASDIINRKNAKT